MDSLKRELEHFKNISNGNSASDDLIDAQRKEISGLKSELCFYPGRVFERI